jgi:hypothetical protein
MRSGGTKEIVTRVLSTEATGTSEFTIEENSEEKWLQFDG